MATEAPKPASAAAAPEAAPVEKTKNCANCGKPVKKLTRYYRDGKFYCAKKCWRAMIEKTKTEKKDDAAA